MRDSVDAGSATQAFPPAEGPRRRVEVPAAAGLTVCAGRRQGLPLAAKREQTGRRVAWTGHRPDLFQDPDEARAVVIAIARSLLQDGVARYVVGGQRGVDTWAAQAARSLGVPFEMILPQKPALFAALWAADDRTVLQVLVCAAQRVEWVGGELEAAFSQRNRRLVQSADLLVAIWTGTTGGGTAETIGFARSLGVAIREVLLPPSPLAETACGRGR